MAAYRAANAERIKMCKAEHYRTNREKLLVRQAAYYKDNQEKRAAYHAAYFAANREKFSGYNAKWYAANAVKQRAIKNAYQATNPDKRRAKRTKRRAAEIQRTPAWADTEAIKLVYLDAVTRPSDELMHVDHIVPLRGRLVSGLHVANNLRVIPAGENWRKNASFDPMTHVHEVNHHG